MFARVSSESNEKENIMDQRIKKIKLFRTLKVVYYCLGLPVFFLAVVLLASQFYGNHPFMGDPGSGLFGAWKAFFGSSAMYGVWIAAAVWLVIGIVQIICNFAVKNRRTRAVVVVAVMLIVLLVPVFVIDAVYTAKIDDLASSAPAGVTVEKYTSQLSYYHTNTQGDEPTGKKTSLTDSLVERVDNFLTVYNLPFYGAAKGLKANNFSNQGLYYDDFGFDYDEDGVGGDAGDHILIQNPTNAKADKDGKIRAKSLTLVSKNGANTATVSGNFYCAKYSQPVPSSYNSSDTKDVEAYVWYDEDKASLEPTNGVYGEAYYNKNGLLSDGYIYSFDVALNILEAYYSAQVEMTEAYAEYRAAGRGTLTEEEIRSAAVSGAQSRLVERYTGANATEQDKELWERENAMAADYSLTTSELNTILSVLGGQVGTADFLKTVANLLGSIMGDGIGINVILELLLSPELATWAANALGIQDMAIQISWMEDNNNEGHLRVTLTGGSLLVGGPVSLDLDENFSVASIRALLEGIGISNNMLAEIIGMIGLAVEGDFTDDTAGLEAMLGSLLSTLYWYQSPVLDTVYDYYVDPTLDTDRPANVAIQKYQAAYAKYMRALYEGGSHGYMIGSRLIGSTIGDGTYSSEFGLKSLAEVQQLKIDVSYQAEMYPILAVRDMLMTLAVFMLFFTILSYIAADREILYATGQIDPQSKKDKKKKSKNGDDEGEKEIDSVVPEEEATLLVSENNEEVL